MQTNLFNQTELFHLPDADVEYLPHFLSPDIADQLLSELTEHLAWRQESIRMFGRVVKIPRLQAWYGDEKSVYRYSGLTLNPHPWDKSLKILKLKLEEYCACRFNAVLANLYRDGNDSMGWHADDEPELGPQPVIASLSLGAERRFLLRHNQQSLKTEIELGHGSLLVMKGATQHFWQHSIPKTRKGSGIRLNLTFRYVISGYRNGILNSEKI